MIRITEKSKCCGCTACLSICPKQCISLEADEEGFLYPKVDEKTCVNCGACENVCPVLHTGKSRMPLYTMAARNSDGEVLKQSSSGGVFSLLAQHILENKHGVIFGAMWAGDEVVHGSIERVEDLWRLRGSKYVQSRMGDTFNKVKRLLQEGRYVMFVGTPCQVAGLKSFLKKENERLLTVDLACHGTPSPKVLAIYLAEIKLRYGVQDVSLNFRDKSTGWDSYSISAYSGSHQIISEYLKQNSYMQGYLHELYSRPICHACPFKEFRSGSDITLADFWGIKNACPEMYDRRGVSLVLIHNDKGKVAIGDIAQKLTVKHVSYEEAIKENSSLLTSKPAHEKRAIFFRGLSKKKKFSSQVKKITSMGLLKVIRLQLYLFLIKIKSKCVTVL